jgi:hypothetical protein
MRRINFVFVLGLLFLFSSIFPSFSKEVTCTVKHKKNGGLFGYKYVTTEKDVKQHNGDTWTFYNIYCEDGGFHGCRFAFNAGCSEDNLPFGDQFYNNLYDEIDLNISNGILSGTVQQQYSTSDCAGDQTIYVVTQIWDASDEFNSNQQITVVPLQ